MCISMVGGKANRPHEILLDFECPPIPTTRFPESVAANRISREPDRIAGYVHRLRNWLSDRDRAKAAANKSCNALARRLFPARQCSGCRHRRYHASRAYSVGCRPPVPQARRGDSRVALRPSKTRREMRRSRHRNVGRDVTCRHDNADKKTACHRHAVYRDNMKKLLDFEIDRLCRRAVQQNFDFVFSDWPGLAIGQFEVCRGVAFG